MFGSIRDNSAGEQVETSSHARDKFLVEAALAGCARSAMPCALSAQDTGLVTHRRVKFCNIGEGAGRPRKA
jgi:hypothetical protein